MRVKLNIPEPENRSAYHRHEVFFAPSGNRQQSLRWGCVAYLPAHSHNMSDNGVHFNKEEREKLQQEYEQMLYDAGWTVKEVIETFGKSWLGRGDEL